MASTGAQETSLQMPTVAVCLGHDVMFQQADGETGQHDRL